MKKLFNAGYNVMLMHKGKYRNTDIIIFNEGKFHQR